VGLTGTGHRWLVAMLMAALVAASGTAATAAPGERFDVVVRAADSGEAGRVVASHGGEVTTELTYLGAVAAVVDAGAMAALQARPDVQVTVDHVIELSAADLVEAGPDVVADQAQLAALKLPPHWSPFAGSGVGVALLDTGVADVPELEGRIVRGPDYSGDGDGIDRHGHGTFMAGLIAGDGRATGGDDPRFGVAPGAHIVSLKLAGRDGQTSLSRVLDAIGWVIVNQDEHGVRVMNLSIGAQTKRSPQADPLAAAVEAAWASGITVVTASGNEGDGTVTSPGRDPWVITVGATDPSTAEPTVAEWSGNGKVAGNLKPEVLAPGVSTVSLRAPGSAIDEGFPEAHVDDRYMRGSGTSMSTALVSGAAAVLAEFRPFATPDDIKGALASTGDTIAGEIGAAVDLAAADAADADPSWQQTHPIGFKGLGGKVRAGMPWQGADGPGVGVTWARARWMDGEWQRARWMDGEWQRARWMDDDWARARWMDSDWARARWMDGEWQRARWMDDHWTRARWMEQSFARARWMDANFARARWMDVDWARARWMTVDWSAEFDLAPPATWEPPASTNGRRRP
jgi:serine protease AprX